VAASAIITATYEGGTALHHIIVNPAAGKGRSLALLPKLLELMEIHGMPCEVCRTARAMDAFRMAQAACEAESRGIIGIGGDGTIQEITAGMAQAAQGQALIPTPLGVMPCGSGNDFALTIQGKKKADSHYAVKAFFHGIKENRTRKIDLIKADGMAYINIANMGLDARIVQNAAGLKKTFGRYAYLAAVYKSIAQHSNMGLAIEVNGERLEGAYTLLAACNGQYYGGGMRIAPAARVDDGKITLCLVGGLSRPKTMVLFPSLLLQAHTRLKAVRFIPCERFTLHYEGAQALCMDGNLYEKKGPVTFEVMPRALKLFTF
jgi:YegS/Rv2252/BmrU family lipid kinase